MMPKILRPQGVPLSPDEQVRQVTMQVEHTIVNLTQQIAQHLFQVRLVKMAEYDEVNIDQLAQETTAQALRLSIKSLRYIDSKSTQIEAAARLLAQDIVKRSSR